MSESAIHDIGYQRYRGRRLGRSYARKALYTHSFRTAFGLGRSGKAKIFPWLAASLFLLIAVIVVAIRSQTGRLVISYIDLPQSASLLVLLFVATAAPELVSRDLRSKVLPLYFSRPIAPIRLRVREARGADQRGLADHRGATVRDVSRRCVLAAVRCDLAGVHRLRRRPDRRRDHGDHVLDRRAAGRIAAQPSHGCGRLDRRGVPGDVRGRPRGHADRRRQRRAGRTAPRSRTC